MVFVDADVLRRQKVPFGIARQGRTWMASGRMLTTEVLSVIVLLPYLPYRLGSVTAALSAEAAAVAAEQR